MIARRARQTLARALCIGAAFLLLGADPYHPTVSIADGGLTPTEVTVVAGGSVAWINHGTRQHEITAATNSFPSFSLAPEGTRHVPFMKPGKYPYLLDAAIKGTVVVAVAGGRTSAGEGSPTCRLMADATLTTYRYDVRVVVHREATHPGPGNQKTAIDWKAGWVASMSVVRCGDTVQMNIPAVTDVMRAGIGPSDALPGGQFDTTIDLSEKDCHYNLVARNLPAITYLRAAADNPSKTSLDFLAGQDFLKDNAARSAYFDREDEVRVGACGEHKMARSRGYTRIGAGNAGLEVEGFSGVMIGDDQLHLSFTMPPDLRPATPIFDALAAGKGFNHDTETLTFQDKDGSTSAVRATVSFSRLEN